MKLLSRIFRFYINSSIHVALAVCSLAAITAVELGLSIPRTFWGFLFFGTITGYNFVKYAKIAGLHHRSLTDSLQTIQIFSFLCFGLFLFFSFQLSVITLLITSAFGILTLLYALPVFSGKNLRRISGLKIFIVAMVWAGVSVIVPVVASEAKIEGDTILSFIQRILVVIVLIIPFEIRDLRYDLPGLKTFPQQIGIRGVKVAGILILGLVVLLESFKETILIPHLISLFFLWLIGGLVLLLSQKEQSPYFASFWVEGIPIIWYTFLLLIL